MPKELRVTAVITVPDGVFEEAAAIAAAQPDVLEFQSALADAVGADNVRQDIELVTPRPRGAQPTVPPTLDAYKGSMKGDAA
jgi:hypothetical protein